MASATARLPAGDMGPHPISGGVVHLVDCGVPGGQTGFRLYLGGADAAAPEILRALRVRRVVRLYGGPPDVRDPAVSYHVLPALDTPGFDIRPMAVEAARLLKRARARGESVLVHCHAGISRSATAVLLFLMTEYRLPLADALPGLREIRPCVSPNSGFMEFLRATDAQVQRRAGRGEKRPVGGFVAYLRADPARRRRGLGLIELMGR